jgi:cysteine synthase A
MAANVLMTIGNTPLIVLERLGRRLGCRLFGKWEAPNPGGSIKDRAALAMVTEGLHTGAIGAGTTIVESSSGNMGIGLAQACAYLGLRFICVVDTRTTAQNLAILRAYGAEIEVVEDPDSDGGGLVGARIKRVAALVQAIGDAYWPNQYANEQNARAHRTTMHEIATELGGAVDYLFCPTSTCGTMRGCAEYVKEKGLATRIIAVDARGSAIFDDGTATAGRDRRLIPGHGSGIRPALFRHDLASACVHVSDLECVVGCRRLVRSEGMLAGGSSGAAYMAVERVRESIEDGAACVIMCPDRGERYLDTIYCDEWVRRHFGEVNHLWEEPRRVWQREHNAGVGRALQ